jgi:hypothetical protein
MFFQYAPQGRSADTELFGGLSLIAIAVSD